MQNFTITRWDEDFDEELIHKASTWRIIGFSLFFSFITTFISWIICMVNKNLRFDETYIFFGSFLVFYLLIWIMDNAMVKDLNNKLSR